MKAVVTSLAVILLAGLPAAAALDPPDLERYLRWGPLRVRPGFRISNFGYDDNILFSSATQTVGDYSGTVSPDLEGLVLFGSRAFVTFDAGADYTAYLDNSELNYLNHEETVRLTVPVRRIGVFAQVDYEDQQLRPVDREDARSQLQRDGYEAGLLLQPGWRTEIEIGRRFDDLHYDDRDFVTVAPISQRLNREEAGLTLDVTYELKDRLSLRLDAEQRAISFDNDEFQIPGADPLVRDTDQWQLRAGTEFGENGTLSGRFLAGWAVIDAEAPELPDLAELVGEAELTYKFNRHTWLRLDGLRRPGFAVIEGNAYFLETRTELRAVRFLNRSLGVEAAVSRGKLSFPESFSGFERRDDIASWDAGMRLRLSDTGLGRSVEYRVRYQHYKRESNSVFANQERNSIGVNAVWGY